MQAVQIGFSGKRHECVIPITGVVRTAAYV